MTNNNKSKMFSVGFASSPCVGVGVLWVLWFSPQSKYTVCRTGQSETVNCP